MESKIAQVSLGTAPQLLAVVLILFSCGHDRLEFEAESRLAALEEQSRPNAWQDGLQFGFSIDLQSNSGQSTRGLRAAVPNEGLDADLIGAWAAVSVYDTASGSLLETFHFHVGPEDASAHTLSLNLPATYRRVPVRVLVSLTTTDGARIEIPLSFSDEFFRSLPVVNTPTPSRTDAAIDPLVAEKSKKTLEAAGDEQ